MVHNSKNREIIDHVKSSDLFKRVYINETTAKPGTLLCAAISIYPSVPGTANVARALFTFGDLNIDSIEREVKIMTIVSIRFDDNNHINGKILIKTVENVIDFWCYHDDKFYLTYR